MVFKAISRDEKELEELVTGLKKLACSVFETICQSFDYNSEELDCIYSGDLSKAVFESFMISDIKINNPFIAAPMAGISDNTYRIFAKLFGCSLVFSEMATSHGLMLKHEKSFDITRITDFERPCSVQIFGSDPDIITQAALAIEKNADIIDVNMGCPVPKVLKTKSGGYLLNEPETISRIVRKLKGNIKKPVTVKLRIGWDENNINVLEIAKIAQLEGADAVSIHGRTVKQGYSGKADYEHIKKVKEIIKIPVIASGDIQNANIAARVLDYTGCDGLMVGRAARGNPWVFAELLLGLLKIRQNRCMISEDQNHDKFKSIEDNLFADNLCLTNDMKIEVMNLYLKFMIYFKGEDRAVKEFRKILGWAFKGQRDIASIKNGFFKIESFEDAEAILESLR